MILSSAVINIACFDLLVLYNMHLLIGIISTRFIKISRLPLVRYTIQFYKQTNYVIITIELYYNGLALMHPLDIHMHCVLKKCYNNLQVQCETGSLGHQPSLYFFSYLGILLYKLWIMNKWIFYERRGVTRGLLQQYSGWSSRDSVKILFKLVDRD